MRSRMKRVASHSTIELHSVRNAIWCNTTSESAPKSKRLRKRTPKGQRTEERKEFLIRIRRDAYHCRIERKRGKRGPTESNH